MILVRSIRAFSIFGNFTALFGAAPKMRDSSYSWVVDLLNDRFRFVTSRITSLVQPNEPLGRFFPPAI
jgi:hypothetical protein